MNIALDGDYAEGEIYLIAMHKFPTPDGRDAEVVLSGSTLVGLAFDDAGNMIVVSTQCVYRAPMGIRGYSL